MQNDRDLPREKARYQPPTIQVVKLLTKETVLGVCKTISTGGAAAGGQAPCATYSCIDNGTT